MLADARVVAVLPVVDLDRARSFYEEKLGLKAASGPDGLMFECGQGTILALYEHGSPNRAGHTQAGWEVDNIEEAVQGLAARGVVFEQYDLPGLKTDERGIARAGAGKGAWFKDTEGNILSVFQFD
jgi:catechol 2,3-dioxygenase-like lactoylglutathione lyase family enzyme